MSLLQAAILGIVQGVTEFLPISSSAHLVLTSFFLRWKDQGLFFDIAAHLGTLVSVIFFFRRDLARLIVGTAQSGEGHDWGYRRPSLGAALLLATVPVAVAGWLFEDSIATTVRWPGLIALTSILFGLLLAWADGRSPARPRLFDLSWRMALLIGLAQALALIPGVSRSGVTLTAALALGFAREPAARFSFLLAIPVGVLVAIKQWVDLSLARASPDYWALGVGFAAATISSYLTIGWLLGWVRRRSLKPFAIYRVILGLLILVLVLTGARSGT